MEIRTLTMDEFEAGLDLSEYAFQYKLSEEHREAHRGRFVPERNWGVFEEKELLAKLTLLPLQLYMQGQPVLMGGIAGVASWPEKRRSGLVSRLLSTVLARMNEQGYSLSCLHPFSIPFYRKFGWEVYTDYKKYTIPVNQFPSKRALPGSIKRDIKDIALLNRLYEAFASRYNGTLLRNERWWTYNVLTPERHTAVYYSENGEPEGYILYRIENRELTVHEFVFLHETARQGLWTYLSNHDSMVTQAIIDRVPSNDLLPFLLNDPRCKQEVMPYFMARIVNAATLIQQYRFNKLGSSESPIQLRLRLRDDFAAWNDGLWGLEISLEGQGKLQLVAEEEANTQENRAEDVLDCNIQTLTALMLGYKRPLELFDCGQLKGPLANVELLERLLPIQQTALMDFF